MSCPLCCVQRESTKASKYEKMYAKVASETAGVQGELKQSKEDAKRIAQEVNAVNSRKLIGFPRVL